MGIDLNNREDEYAYRAMGKLSGNGFKLFCWCWTHYNKETRELKLKGLESEAYALGLMCEATGLDGDYGCLGELVLKGYLVVGKNPGEVVDNGLFYPETIYEYMRRQLDLKGKLACCEAPAASNGTSKADVTGNGKEITWEQEVWSCSGSAHRQPFNEKEVKTF